MAGPLHAAYRRAMRKQYHFRPSERGLLAWDVDSLVLLTADQPDEELPLSAIGEIDENWWFAFGETPTVRALVEHVRLIEECDLRYPILVDPDGRVMDGMHSVAKALSLGRTMVTARRLPALPAPDFIGVAPSDLPYE
ncbi:MAG: hypothetical protein JWO22_2490 [Frankiales bacterium]|nr:hypothetical protein [Frankiales bacterium]